MLLGINFLGIGHEGCQAGIWPSVQAGGIGKRDGDARASRRGLFPLAGQGSLGPHPLRGHGDPGSRDTADQPSQAESSSQPSPLCTAVYLHYGVPGRLVWADCRQCKFGRDLTQYPQKSHHQPHHLHDQVELSYAVRRISVAQWGINILPCSNLVMPEMIRGSRRLLGRKMHDTSPGILGISKVALQHYCRV